MEQTQVLDMRGLSHEEKHSRLFPSLDGLAEGQVLQVHFDFNPLPLVHMLKARPEFVVSQESGGPQEWILRIERPRRGTVTKADLKGILREMKGGNMSEDARKAAREVLKSVDAKTLGILEQELIREGVSSEEIRENLCEIHLEAIHDALVANRIDVASPHPIHTLMEEHKVILDTLHRLRALVDRIKQVNSYEELGDDLPVLKDLAHHLVEAESHHQREEDVLFPRIEKHDITEPTKIMKEDHTEFLQRKRALYKVAHSGTDMRFADFKEMVIGLGAYLAKELERHIFKEDNIIYQIALQVLTPQEWADVKRDCDKIGYCCFTPGDQCPTVELDLRPLPPRQRHQLIFDTWRSLTPGSALRIINDHDPKPLYYQFEAEHKGEFTWDYDQQGPEDWAVRIGRTAPCSC